MRDLPPLEAVRERDVDLILLEAIIDAPRFRSWLLDNLGLTAGDDGFLGAWHSVVDARWGESDIEVGIETPDADRVLAMIENKIDAPFQDEQDKRYHARGRKLVREGPWDRYITCLAAPEAYINRHGEDREFDAILPYEDILEWFEDDGANETPEFKPILFRTAISQERRGYTPEVNERVTRFWRDYWEIARDDFPNLRLPQPGPKPAGSDWIRFDLPDDLEDLRLQHKLADGGVDLEFPGKAGQLDALKGRFEPTLPHNAEFRRAGSSAAVRVPVPPVDRFAPTSQQEDRLREALREASTLFRWLLDNRDEIQPFTD